MQSNAKISLSDRKESLAFLHKRGLISKKDLLTSMHKYTSRNFLVSDAIGPVCDRVSIIVRRPMR
jgi:hypothetical protein